MGGWESEMTLFHIILSIIFEFNIIKIKKLINVLGNTPWNQIMWTGTLQNSHNTSEVQYLVCLEITHSLHFWYQTKLPSFSVHLRRKDTWLGKKLGIFKNLFNWRLITLQYCIGFCHTLIWISHGCTCVPHPEPPSYLPPHLIPLGHPRALALSTLSHASNLDRRSVSHMIIYMSQIIPPSPFPTETRRLLYISASLSLSRI